MNTKRRQREREHFKTQRHFVFPSKSLFFFSGFVCLFFGCRECLSAAFGKARRSGPVGQGKGGGERKLYK